jgi:dipeptide/tripeptide permease
VRVTVATLGEERTLVVAMAATASGFGVLSYTTSAVTLVPALTLVAIGYGLAVPCLSALFAQVGVRGFERAAVLLLLMGRHSL